MTFKKILIFTSFIFSCIFCVCYKINNFNINNTSVIVEENNKIKLAKIGTTTNSVTLNATVNPVGSDTLVWSVNFKTGSSNVNNYVTISPSSNTLTCTITFKRAFTTQIILTCSASKKSDVKATATIDYVSRNLSNTFIDEFDSNLVYANSYSTTISDLINRYLSMMIDLYCWETTGGSLTGYCHIVSYSKFYLSTSYYIDLTPNSPYWNLTLAQARNKYCEDNGLGYDGISSINNDWTIGVTVNYNVGYYAPGDWEQSFINGFSESIWFMYNWNWFEG